jgi:hypothetical protein
MCDVRSYLFARSPNKRAKRKANQSHELPISLAQVSGMVVGVELKGEIERATLPRAKNSAAEVLNPAK